MFNEKITTTHYESYFHFLEKSAREIPFMRLNIDLDTSFRVATTYFSFINFMRIPLSKFLHYWLSLNTDNQGKFYRLFMSDYILSFFSTLRVFDPSVDQLVSVWLQPSTLEKISQICYCLDEISELTSNRLTTFIEFYFCDDNKRLLPHFSNFNASLTALSDSILSLVFLPVDELPVNEDGTCDLNYHLLQRFASLDIRATDLRLLHQKDQRIFAALCQQVGSPTFYFWENLKQQVASLALFYRVLLCCQQTTLEKITNLFMKYTPGESDISNGVAGVVDACAQGLKTIPVVPVEMMPAKICYTLKTAASLFFVKPSCQNDLGDIPTVFLSPDPSVPADIDHASP